MESSPMLPPCSSGSSLSWSFLIFDCSRGQASAQEVKTKSAIQTRPSRSSRRKALPSSATSEKAGSCASTGSSGRATCRNISAPMGTASASAAKAIHAGCSTSLPGFCATACMAGSYSGENRGHDTEFVRRTNSVSCPRILAPVGQQPLAIEQPDRDEDERDVRDGDARRQPEVEPRAEGDAPRELHHQEPKERQHRCGGQVLGRSRVQHA